ncbi:MAG TPA: PQQ-dependent dehydrogenase, methanol/ethanol family, partial [Candidatus Acidoferrales bacterium]|nr:PQQ-dependent dehydrogenase, methanol/ethanol family [Candidatus Acidoferrales bacterium]
CSTRQTQAPPERAAKAADVGAARIMAADREPGNWMTTGRTYGEQRFSPLKDINDKNAAQLGLAWSYDLDTRRGQEATPLVIDGVMYFTTAWSKVVALDAATGARLWTFDPKVNPAWAVNACCDVVNRGLAAWNGKVYLGTLDGRLVALDAATGKVVWEKLTIDPKFRYTITGAPRVVKGKVLIGNGGAEVSVRGYLSAYDAETGNLAWRFYTIPGDPSKPFEDPILKKAAKTWTGEWWKLGGGGTVWDSMAYDPELDLLYVGVGNGGPWDERIRSPKGGDNLFLGSIVALKPETGEYVWHYQETPGDMWDYTSTQHIIVADLTIDGQVRKVLLHAPKNGFFYVIDRTNGALVSAKPYTYENWASGVDLKTGRPVETPVARYRGSNPAPVVPGPLGAHSWQPMSYSPQTGLVYFSVHDLGFKYQDPKDFHVSSLAMNFGVDVVAAGMPQDAQIKKAILSTVKGRLTAWDPIAQKQVWQAPRVSAWNGGTLATAGKLVFEGTGDGYLEAYRADTGEKVWSYFVQTGVVAAPVTYTVKGEQYVAILAGWGGVFALAPGEVALRKNNLPNIGRMLAFKIGGNGALPPPPEVVTPVLDPPASTASAATVAKGQGLYQTYCGACHGDVAVSGGILPDLRYSGTLGNDQWFNIVLGGALEGNGMVNFSKEVTREDAVAIREYVIFRANESVRQAKAGK